MKLHLESLDDRLVPASLLPDAPSTWGVPYSDVQGFFTPGITTQTVYVAGVGGSIHVEVQDDQTKAILFDQVLDDPDYRDGGAVVDIPATDSHERTAGVPGIPDYVIVYPDKGGGPIATELGFDSATGMMQVVSQAVVLDPNYRGGMQVSYADVNGSGHPSAIFLPALGGGGGPQLTAIDPVTHAITASFFVGPADSRVWNYTFDPLGGQVTTPKGETAIEIQTGPAEPSGDVPTEVLRVPDGVDVTDEFNLYDPAAPIVVA